MRRMFVVVLLVAAACAPRLAPADRSIATGNGSSDAAIWADSAARLIELGVHAQNRAHIADARALAERALTRFPDDPLLLHYQGYALYREAGLVWSVDESAVPPLLRESERLLSRSFALLPLAESAALLARIQGNLSALYPRLAADLGARARGFRADAERLGSDNPRVWLLRGQASLYTPEMHGGGLRNAERQLSRAVSLFAGDRPRPAFPAWGEAEAHAWLGQVYARSGRPAEARRAYEEALAREPQYIWVRESLLPALASVTPESPARR